MSATQKKKLCWNCEGRVSLEEENCPYCAVYVGPPPDENDKDILAPPYRIVDSEDEDVPSSPYTVSEEEEEEVEVELTEVRSDLKKIVLPLGLLSAGSMLFLFGLILLIFSNHGIFTVSWNGEYWYMYLVFGLPMVFFGWRVLRRFEEDEQKEPAPESYTNQSS